MSSTPHENYRASMRVRTADGDAATLIVTRQAGHRAGPIWLTLGSTTASTAALSDDEVGELTGLLTAAWRAGGHRGTPAQPSQAAVDAALAVLTEGRLREMLAAAYEIDLGV